MATADEEHFLRSSLLLLKGSLFITKKILIREEQREIQQTGRDIGDLLKSYKQKLEQQFQNYKQRAILFPQNGKTEVEKWDISLLTGVLLIVFHSSLSDDERIAVKHIKYQRNEIYAHPAVASISINDYNDICSELKAAYDTLASGFSSDVKEQCNNNVETCLKGHLDLKTSLEQLKKMSEMDDKFREILTRIDTSGKETTLALTDTFRQESSALKGGISMEISRSENNICDTIRDLQLKKEDLYEIVLNAVRQVQQEKRVKRKVKVVDSELEVSGNETDQPRVDEAEEILVRVTNEAIRRAQTSKENIYIREKIQEILDNIECQTDLKAVTAEKGCVIIRFDCSTYEQLFNLIIYMESKDMKQRLNKLAVSLSCRLNTKDKLHVSFSLSFKTLQSIVEELEANCRREYKRSVRIPIQVESVQGMNRLFELFERGGLTNNLNKLSEALTEKVGAKINVKSSININQLKDALEEFDHVRKATMQIDKTEDRCSEKKGKDADHEEDVEIVEAEEKICRRIASDKDDKKEDDGASIVYELKTAVKDTSTVEDIYSQTFKTDRDSDWQRQERERQIPNDENEYLCRSNPTPLPRRDAYKEDGELSIPPITAYDDISSDIKPEKVEKLQIFQSPQCLIKSDTDGELSVVEETMSQLEEISFGVNVVAIAGLYRTGKSYLMNRLAHVSSGFALRNTTESKTKGIWVWCKRHPTQRNQVLVLLDTEGLGDVKKGDIQHDNKIFTLAALLSSTLVYNMMGAFNQDAVEKLTFITEMSKHMKFANGMSGDNCFDFVLPGFVLCLRDFFLELETSDGRKLTPDEYLEDCLKSKEVKTKEDEKYNRPRECIRKYFPRRRVFTFDRPGGKKVMARLDSVHDNELVEDFVDDTVKFTSYIFQCEPKMLLNRQHVSGSMLAKLAREYVKSFREGGVPCVDDAMITMARQENENMVKKAVSDFEKKMEGVQLPIYNRAKLLEINFSIQKMILATLVKNLVFDDNDEAKKSAEKQMDDIAGLYEQKNNEELHKICTEKLENYYKSIAENISNNKYNVPRGYQVYKKDMSELEEKYSEELQHVEQFVRMEVLKSFHHNTRKDEEKILANDQLLTEKEKEEELRERDAIADQKFKESQDLMLKELEKQKLDHEENMRRITEEQRQKEEANTKMHMNAILEAKSKEQSFIEDMRRQRERFEAESRRGIIVKAFDFFFGT